MIQTSVRHTEGEDLILLARPEAGGSVLTRSEVSAATIEVYEVGGATPNTDLLLSGGVTTKPLSVTADPDGASDQVLFGAIQTDDSWTQSGGYTFACVLRDTELHLEGGKTYRVEVELDAGHSTPTWPQQASYGKLAMVWIATVTSRAGA